MKEKANHTRLYLFLFSYFIVCIAHAQNVGIGTTTPMARLEIIGTGNTSVTNNLLLKSLSGDTIMRVRNDGRIGINFNGPTYGRNLNLGGTGINFYKTDAIFGGAVFPTDTSLVIWSNSNDNNYVILQPSWGMVGIGTYGPKALLHVDGNFILGQSGTAIDNIIKISVLKNIGSIPANTSSTQTFVVNGAEMGATVYITPDLALPDGFVIAYARVSAADTVEVKFFNSTAAAINPASMNFHITVIK